MATERRGGINAACGGAGILCILIYHGKCFPELLRELGFEVFLTQHTIVYSPTAVSFPPYPHFGHFSCITS